MDEGLGSWESLGRHRVVGGCCAQSQTRVAGRMALWGRDPGSLGTMRPQLPAWSGIESAPN